VYNLQGNLVGSTYVEGEELIFDISKLAPGIYVLVLSKSGNLRIAKFIRP